MTQRVYHNLRDRPDFVTAMHAAADRLEARASLHTGKTRRYFLYAAEDFRLAADGKVDFITPWSERERRLDGTVD